MHAHFRKKTVQNERFEIWFSTIFAKQIYNNVVNFVKILTHLSLLLEFFVNSVLLKNREVQYRSKLCSSSLFQLLKTFDSINVYFNAGCVHNDD